jgi:hypothetical protein
MWIQLRHRFVFWFSSILGARGRPLLGPSPALIIVSISTAPLTLLCAFFKESAELIFGKKKGRQNAPRWLNIHFAKWIVTADAS